MKGVFITVVVGLGVLFGASGVANANGIDKEPPGPSPQLDSICYSNPAFVADPPVARLNGVPLQNPKVGLRAKNSYCVTVAVAPPNYGNN